MTKVKICGITNLEDALVSVRCGADMLGFNFFSGSKRYIKSDEAAQITAELVRSEVLTIGVFVNAAKEEIAHTSAMLKLDCIQLHGDESDDFVAELSELTSTPIIKAIRGSEHMIADAIDSSATFVLLDGYSADSFGGSGKTFDWNIAKRIAAQLPDSVFVAGGLTPENVADAIRIARPFAVDAASGVESSPGKKDPNKIAAFIKAAKEVI